MVTVFVLTKLHDFFMLFAPILHYLLFQIGDIIELPQNNRFQSITKKESFFFLRIDQTDNANGGEPYEHCMALSG